MKPFERLEMQELVDLLNQYLSEYSRLKKQMSSYKELKKCKALVESLSDEIDKRKRSTIWPYNFSQKTA